jgi:hypothetical protein
MLFKPHVPQKGAVLLHPSHDDHRVVPFHLEDFIVADLFADHTALFA